MHLWRLNLRPLVFYEAKIEHLIQQTQIRCEPTCLQILGGFDDQFA